MKRRTKRGCRGTKKGENRGREREGEGGKEMEERKGGREVRGEERAERMGAGMMVTRPVTTQTHFCPHFDICGS